MTIRSLLLFTIAVVGLQLISCNEGRQEPEITYWKISTEYDSLGRIELEENRQKWTEVKSIKNKLDVSLIYATEDNFTGQRLYECPRCFLTAETANALYEWMDALNAKGYILQVLDCYRPRRVQQVMYDAYPDPVFIRDPMHGAMPNRGLSVSVRLLDKDGNLLDMGSEVNQFDKTSRHDFFDFPQEVVRRRKDLRETGRDIGFQAVRYKWWQYNFRNTSALANDYIWFCNEE